MAAIEYVRKIISSTPVVVFSKTYCPFCKKAKGTLTELGAKFTTVELDTMPNGSDIQAALATVTGRRTVPNVFVSGKSIGGGDDTERLKNSGELLDMLKKAGAIKGSMSADL